MRRNSVPSHVRKQLSRESNKKPLHTNSQSRDYYSQGFKIFRILSKNEKYEKLWNPNYSKTKLRQKSLPYSGFPWHLDDSEQVTLNKEKNRNLISYSSG